MAQRLGVEGPAKRIEDDVEMPSHFPDRYRRIIEAHYKALLAYRPGPYAGVVTLFRTKAQPLMRAHWDNGWGRLVQGGVDIYKVDGLHMNFLQEPYVGSVATQLRIALEKSRNRAGMRPPQRPRVSGRTPAAEPAYSPPREAVRVPVRR
jgi:hypothetical protein